MELNLVVLSLARQMYVPDSLVSQTFVKWEMSFLTYKWCMWTGGKTDTFLHHESVGQRTKKAFLWIWMKPVYIEYFFFSIGCFMQIPKNYCMFTFKWETTSNVCTNFNSSVGSKDKSSVMIFRTQKNVGVLWWLKQNNQMLLLLTLTAMVP